MATLLEQVEVDTELRLATIAGRNPWALAVPLLPATGQIRARIDADLSSLWTG